MQKINNSFLENKNRKIVFKPFFQVSKHCAPSGTTSFITAIIFQFSKNLENRLLQDITFLLEQILEFLEKKIWKCFHKFKQLKFERYKMNEAMHLLPRRSNGPKS